MGLVTDDLREWLAEDDAHPAIESEFESNPFRRGAAREAQSHLDVYLHALWHRLTCRIHKWSEHGDGLTR